MGREIDVYCVEHSKRAKAAGVSVGLYTFFHPSQPAERQIDLTIEAHDRCGLGVGDLAPALDVESITNGAQCTKAWVEPAKEILEALTERYETAIRYHNVSDWYSLGRPTSLQQWDLWLADYTPPADLPCLLWQQKSAKVDGYGSIILDQNVAYGPLRTIGPKEDHVVIVEPNTKDIPWPRWDYAEHSRLRNQKVSQGE